MASYLASIYGTEQDKVNCSFYYKIGACRHGDRCSRKHTRPPFSQTILISNVYQNPRHADANCTLSDEELQRDFDDFFEDFFCELARYGTLIEMHVCDNVGEHLIGNVYARYEFEEEAGRAVDALNERWYAGRPLFSELSPVTDFREACCRQNETNECNRGGFCNFMHLRYASPALVRELHHELSAELAFRRAKEESTGKKMGWKDEIAANDDTVPDWKKGKSGGDWRNGPRTLPVEGDDQNGAHDDPADQRDRRRSDRRSASPSR
ncbi:RNA-binding domain-containing protein [Ceraceosorus guamensis]|uniref:RNA-binding domain-containing protein n=1 Tax=Ceraceosorus guamensis TaxID=1522189 RepID=A0A316W1K6_9BASI|nr:RNA-binding domain-containing protein [Ceraceosorus guamensis]PWN41545.1 RNA-binding domain-containing protein [Ceraceosorus guamensis]